MFPFELTGMTNYLFTLFIGFLFGFVLERAGFGYARNLAAQFYLYDMRVLKVMFTAIITAMLLVFACSAIGILDFDSVWVSPTYIGPAIIGGFVLGLGFILGGYCPGTSIVSASTFRIDGMFFVLGVALGMFGFALMSPALYDFWYSGGFFGRITLPDILGVDAGVVVLAVFVMAICAFAFAELSERLFQREESPAPPTPRVRMFRRGAIGVGLLIAVGTLAIGQPSADRLMAQHQAELKTRIANREIFIDPAELLGLMYNKQVERILLDVRNESDYTRFHIRDARHVTLDQLKQNWVKEIPVEAIVVVMSNDEALATEAWKCVAVRENINAYVLAGGINRWLDIYENKQADAPHSDQPATGNDTLRHPLSEALGSRFAFARPEPRKLPKDLADRKFAAKIKLKTAVRKEGGGCG